MAVSVARTVGWAINVPTPEQQQKYAQLSGLLQAFGIRYRNELPNGATSLLMKVINRNASVEVYDERTEKDCLYLLRPVPRIATTSRLRCERIFVRSAKDGI
jgi:hypothetical protein